MRCCSACRGFNFFGPRLRFISTVGLELKNNRFKEQQSTEATLRGPEVWSCRSPLYSTSASSRPLCMAVLSRKLKLNSWENHWLKYIGLVCLIVAIQAQAGVCRMSKNLFNWGFLSDILFPIKSSPWKFQMEGAKAQDRRSDGKKCSSRFWHLKHRKYCRMTSDLAP